MRLGCSRKALTLVALAAVTLVTSVFSQTLGASDTPAEAYEKFRKDYVRPDQVPEPADNRLTPARELLGRTLFFDPRLSGSNWISCGSCHNPGFAWGDGLPRAIGDGMKTLGRRTPTILNLAWSESLFWDGRADSLEQQALGPVEAAGEMNLPLDQLGPKLRDIDGYRPLFADAYPGEPIAPPTVAKAIAAFERTVVSATAPFDRWIAGDQTAIGDDAKRGFAVFNQEGRCAKCHSGWRFTDDSFHDIGVRTDDPGRGALFADIPALASALKTPTLRNVDQRAPYMHNGSVATLEEVIDLYDRGGDVRRASLSPDIVALNLTAAQKQDLLAFLRTLSSHDRPVVLPLLPR
jgi:cytochrome c peroxidase